MKLSPQSRFHRAAFNRAAFNLVEIVLALLVVAVGMMAIVGLIPIGSAANREAIASSYSSDAADHYLNWFAAKVQENWAVFVPSNNIPDAPGKVNDIVPGSFDTSALDGENLFACSTISSDSNHKGIYRIVNGPTIDGIVSPDFDAVVRVWVSPTTAWEYDSGGPPYYLEKTDTTFAARAQLNMELSWPTSIPYEGRKKAYYTLEVFKR